MHQRLQSGTASRTSAIFNGVLVVFLVFSIAVVILFLALLVQLWKQQILLLPGRKWTAGWWDSASRWWSFHRRKAFGFQAFGNPSQFHTFTIILKGPHEPMHHPNISQAGNASISQQSEMFESSPKNKWHERLLRLLTSYDLFISLLYSVSTYPLPPHFTSCCCLHCFNVHLPKGLRLGDRPTISCAEHQQRRWMIMGVRTCSSSQNPVEFSNCGRLWPV